MGSDIRTVITKYAFRLPLTPVESDQLAAWRKRMKYHHDLPDRLRDPRWVAQRIDEMSRYPRDRIWQRIQEKIEKAEAEPEKDGAWNRWYKKIWDPARKKFRAFAILYIQPRAMNPNNLKIIGLTAGVVLFLVALLYFGFRGSRSDTGTYRQDVKALQAKEKTADSLGQLLRNSRRTTDSLQGRLQAFQVIDSTKNVQVRALQADRQLIIKKYESLLMYDTLSATDIRRYLSDSLQ